MRCRLEHGDFSIFNITSGLSYSMTVTRAREQRQPINHISIEGQLEPSDLTALDCLRKSAHDSSNTGSLVIWLHLTPSVDHSPRF